MKTYQRPGDPGDGTDTCTEPQFPNDADLRRPCDNMVTMFLDYDQERHDTVRGPVTQPRRRGHGYDDTGQSGVGLKERLRGANDATKLSAYKDCARGDAFTWHVP